jgi:hypothetical protein
LPRTVRRAHASLLAVALSGAGLVTACHGSSSSSQASPTTSASAVPVAPAASSSSGPVASASAHAARLPPRCRAVSVHGTSTFAPLEGVTVDAGPSAILAESADIPDDVWLDLQSGARLTARHPRSTRETTFSGPGRVRSCVGHGEEAWIGSGRFESVSSSGERPGAEEWVVTPFGVVRYASARVAMDVTATHTEIKVTSGVAYAWTSEHASPVTPLDVAPVNKPSIPDGWTRLADTREVTFSSKSPAKPEEAARAAIRVCADAAKTSRDLASAVAGPDASLAQVAPRHVIARHVARAACDVALLRVELLPPSSVRDGFRAELKEADADWRAARSHQTRGHRP